MYRNLTYPVAGDALSAAWARELIEEVRRARITAAWPLVVRSRGPAGTVLGMAHGAAGGGPAPGGAWDVSFSGGAARLTNCCYQRGPVFVWVGTLEGAVTAAQDGATWLGAEIDAETGECAVISGDAGNVCDAAPPPQDRVAIRIPLYILHTRTDPETGAASFSVAVDLRTSLAAVLYV